VTWVYVTNARVVARAGTENASATLNALVEVLHYMKGGRPLLSRLRNQNFHNALELMATNIVNTYGNCQHIANSVSIRTDASKKVLRMRNISPPAWILKRSKPWVTTSSNLDDYPKFPESYLRAVRCISLMPS
jgi:hypothetical protein